MWPLYIRGVRVDGGRGGDLGLVGFCGAQSGLPSRAGVVQDLSHGRACSAPLNEAVEHPSRVVITCIMHDFCKLWAAWDAGLR